MAKARGFTLRCAEAFTSDTNGGGRLWAEKEYLIWSRVRYVQRVFSKPLCHPNNEGSRHMLASVRTLA